MCVEVHDYRFMKKNIMKNYNETNKKHGFTLAELLIVVAIIGVLVAISIPIFNRVLEESREAYDIYTMRAAASAAVDLFYRGVSDEQSAIANGLLWNDSGGNNGKNAYGVYDARTGKFLALSSGEYKQPYGKGTKVDGGTEYTMGNPRGSYRANLDYTKGFVMVSIYPVADIKRIDVYWKGTDKNYIGDKNADNDPNYSIRLYMND